MSEFDRTPVASESLQSGRYFAASYAGEHVAGTEFVIGALFVSFGLGALDVILGEYYLGCKRKRDYFRLI